MIEVCVFIMEKKYWYLVNLPYLPYHMIRYHFPANSHTDFSANSAEQFFSPLTAHLYIMPNQEQPPFTPPFLSSLQSRQWWKASESCTVLLPLIWMIAKGKEEVQEKDLPSPFMKHMLPLSLLCKQDFMMSC